MRSGGAAFIVVLAVLLLLALAIVAMSQQVVNFGLVKTYLAVNQQSFSSILSGSNGRYLFIIYADSQCIACNYLRTQVLTNSTVADYIQSRFIPVYVDLDYSSAQPLANIPIALNGTVYVVEPVGGEVSLRGFYFNKTQYTYFSVVATPTMLVAYDDDGVLYAREIIIGAYPPQMLLYILSLVPTQPTQSGLTPAVSTSLSQSPFSGAAALALSYLAGVGSAIMPCALPALLSIAVLAVNRKINPVALFGGFLVLYVIIGSLFSVLGLSGVAKSTLYLAASIVLIAMGLIFLTPPLYRAFITAISRVQGASARIRPSGSLADFLVGMAITGMWLPCIGPVFAGVVVGSIVEAQMQHSLTMGIALTAAYSLGFVTMAALVFYLATWSRSRVRGLVSWGSVIEKVSGAVMVGLGIYLLWIGGIL